MGLPDGMGDLSAMAASQADVQQKLAIDALTRSLNGGQTKEKKLREACQGFESVFISKLFAQMRATVPKDGLLHGRYEDQYYSMFDKAMSDKLAADGGIGLADMMYRQLKGKVLGQGKNQASPGDTLPANRPVAAHPASGLAFDHIPAPAGRGASAPRPILAQNIFPGAAQASVAPLAPAHAPAQAPANAVQTPAQTLDDASDAASQAASPMAAPVMGDITSEFGWRTDPFKGRQAWHAGMDIAAAEGDPVSACWDGTVVFAGFKGGYGNVVEIEHPGGWKSVYGHLRRFSVQAGDAVAAGGKIAEVGSTGRSTGPHLHFELRRGDAPVDPEAVLAKAGLVQSGQQTS